MEWINALKIETFNDIQFFIKYQIVFLESIVWNWYNKQIWKKYTKLKIVKVTIIFSYFVSYFVKLEEFFEEIKEIILTEFI